MHDRRLDGKTYVFGNQGALFMSAMTWWDHQTQSVWSQPWGVAIAGPLKGARLKPLPAGLVPWGTWRREHPDTLALHFPSGGLGRLVLRSSRQLPSDDFVIGISVGDAARAFYYRAASERRVINDSVGDYPIVLHVDPDTRSINAFVRRVENRVLTYRLDGEALVDQETGSQWDPVRGLATSGRLRGENLIKVPYTPAFDWAWKDFYPHTTFVR